MPAYIEQAIYDEKTPSSIDLTLITRFEEIYYDFFAEKLLKFGKKNKKLRPLIIQALLFKVPTEVSDEKYREYEQMFREKRLNREENIAELKSLNDYIIFLIKQTKEQQQKEQLKIHHHFYNQKINDFMQNTIIEPTTNTKQLRKASIEQLVRLVSLVTLHNMTAKAEDLKLSIKQLTENSFSIGLIGGAGSGKSVIINVLAGTNLVQMSGDINSCTATITNIYHHDKDLKVNIKLKSFDEEKQQHFIVFAFEEQEDLDDFCMDMLPKYQKSWADKIELSKKDNLFKEVSEKKQCDIHVVISRLQKL